MGQDIQIKGRDGTFMGYLATPEGGEGPGGRRPADDAPPFSRRL